MLLWNNSRSYPLKYLKLYSLQRSLANLFCWVLLDWFEILPRTVVTVCLLPAPQQQFMTCSWQWTRVAEARRPTSCCDKAVTSVRTKSMPGKRLLLCFSWLQEDWGERLLPANRGGENVKQCQKKHFENLLRVFLDYRTASHKTGEETCNL